VPGEVIGMPVRDEGERCGAVGVEPQTQRREVEGLGFEIERHWGERRSESGICTRKLSAYDAAMIIRGATRDDLPGIIEIYNESIPGGQATADLEPITVASREAWFGEFDPKRRPCWVAEDEGEVVGCVYLRSFYAGRPAYDATAEISTYLAKSHQGKGLGTILKEKMIAECPRLGVKNLLSFYFDHNEASRRINQKLGFQEAAHLTEIAEVFGKKRGLVIAILRIEELS